MSTVLLLEGPFSPLSPLILRESGWWREQTLGFHYGEPIVFKSLKEFTILAASPGNYNAHSVTFY